MEATEGNCHPKGGVGLGGCETSESPVICIVCQQMADKKESGQGRDRTGDTRIFSPGITSNGPHRNSNTPNQLNTRNGREPNFVCTTVCTNADSLHDIEWQPSSSIGRIVDAWPHLPPHIRESILTLVDSVPCHLSPSNEVNHPSVLSAARNCPDLDGAFKDTITRTLLKALRHCPELYGLKMDSDGWVSTDELGHFLRQLAGTNAPNAKQLQQLFRDIDLADRIQTKPGFVRAAYGHSTDKFAPSISAVPDKPLYHGTSASNWAMIKCFGLSPVKRRYVQLTTDFEYASQIANSHGRSPIVLQVATAHAIECGVKFYPTQTHVWQATAIPAICLQIWLENTDAFEEPLASPGFPKQCEVAPQQNRSFNN